MRPWPHLDSLVGGRASGDGRLQLARVADHVAIGEVDADLVWQDSFGMRFDTQEQTAYAAFDDENQRSSQLRNRGRAWKVGMHA